MKVIYDISPIGSDPSRRAGLARVAESTAARLYDRLGENVRFSATGSLWATFQAEKVLARRNGWQSALNEVGRPARWVHEAERACAHSSSTSDGLLKYGARAGKLLLAQVSRGLNVFRRPVNANALEQADLFHSSYARIPRQVRRALPGKHILTVHDLTPLVLGEDYFSSDQIGITRRIIDSVQADDWVITVSQSTKNDLCERRPIDPERVFVVPNAASEDFFYPVSDKRRIQEVRAKYGIPEGKYLLSLHSMAPHKNVARLVRSFRQLVRDEKLSDVYLVLAGGLGRPLKEICDDLTLTKDDLQRVHFTGFIEDKDLASVYSGAAAFLFPSLYEGFGLPVLEAMQCGCPVIASSAASIPEIASGAAILVDPYDEKQLAAAILDVFELPNKRAEMAKQGTKEARKFSWSKRTIKILDIYNRLTP